MIVAGLTALCFSLAILDIFCEVIREHMTSQWLERIVVNPGNYGSDRNRIGGDIKKFCNKALGLGNIISIIMRTALQVWTGNNPQCTGNMVWIGENEKIPLIILCSFLLNISWWLWIIFGLPFAFIRQDNFRAFRRSANPPVPRSSHRDRFS